MKLLRGSSLDLRDRQLNEVDSPAALRRLGFAVAVGASGSVGMWSMPVALPFVQADFGIARADASLPYTLAMMGFALGGVAMGRLCDRFGVMVALMLGSLALGIGYAGAALVPGALTFALMHLFIGVGASVTVAPLMADMSQWFARHRGIAVGMAASGNYIGGALWPPLLQHAMATEGWRHTYLGVGVLRTGDAAVTAPPSRSAIRPEPTRLKMPKPSKRADIATDPLQRAYSLFAHGDLVLRQRRFIPHLFLVSTMANRAMLCFQPAKPVESSRT